jgi:hypothetical protein
MKAHGVGETGVLEERFERARGQALGAHGRASLRGEHEGVVFAESTDAEPFNVLGRFVPLQCSDSSRLRRLARAA